MTSFGQGHNQSKSVTQKPVNSFAGSLLENEQKNANLSTNNHDEKIANPFANALKNYQNNSNHFDDPAFLRKQQEETLFQQKKEALRKKLHDRVNPVDTYELFSAREEKSKEELNQVRKELELLIADIKGLNQDVEIVVAQEVVNPGLDGGSYYQNFFFQLRQFIMLIRQKVSSARSWAQQMQTKSKKQYGLNYKKTKDVHASMNNERNAGVNAVG